MTRTVLQAVRGMISALSTQHSALRGVLSTRYPVLQARLAVVVGLLSLVLAGCGYQFRVEGAGPTIGGAPVAAASAAAPHMVIENFGNSTFEPGLELKYTTYARREFSAGSGVRVVPNVNAADLVLKGSIQSVIIPTIAFSTSATFESRVTVIVKATVEEARTKKVIWNQTVTAASEFFVTNDLQFNRVLQTRALEQAGRLIAEDLATRFLNYLETGAKTAEPATPALKGTEPTPHEPSPLGPPGAAAPTGKMK